MNQQIENLVILQIDSRGIATITLNRPLKRNALNMATLDSLNQAIEKIENHQGATAVILRGNGPIFCAGADLKEWAEATSYEARHMSSKGTKIFDRLTKIQAPTIAIIQGGAIGGGLELALACDFRITTNDAKLGFPEVRLGNLPSWGGIMRLLGLVGPGIAKTILLTGLLFSGEEALKKGIVTYSLIPDDIESQLELFLTELLQGETEIQSILKSIIQSTENNFSVESQLAGFTAISAISKSRKNAFFQSKR
jgi:enoyl-CoA hydratase/carnithine racemase